MTFLEARAQVVGAIQHAWATMDDVRFAKALADPAQDVPFEDLKFDSLAAMEVCMELEERTDVEIDLADLVAHPSVNRLAEHLQSRSAAK